MMDFYQHANLIKRITMNKTADGQARIVAEYYSIAISSTLERHLALYKKTDPVLSTLDDRKLILLLVNKAIDEQTELYVDDVKLSRSKNIKLRKTRKIDEHFTLVNSKYKAFGVAISARQYFHRLVLGYLINQATKVVEQIDNN
ncbi:hypothetical protein MTsN2n6_05760 [Vibrio fortis]